MASAQPHNWDDQLGPKGAPIPLVFTRQDFVTYRRRLRRNVDALAQILDQFTLDEDRAMTGMELELYVVGSDLMPAMRNEEVLGAASWRARAWLGWNPGLDEGDTADFVVYPRNPVEDLSVLTEPTCVVLRGRVY